MATPDDEAFLKKYGNYKPASASVPVTTIKPIIGGETQEAAAARRAEEGRKASSEARAAEEEARKKEAAERERIRFEQEQKAGGGAKPTEAQQKTLTLLTRIAGGAKDIQNTLAVDPEAQQAGIFETLSRDVLGEGVITRSIAGADRRIVTDAQGNMLDALLTLGTGAAYNEEQKIANRVSYFPQYGDSQREIAIKNERLNQAIESARIAAGPLAEKFDEAIKPLFGATPAAAPAPAPGGAPAPSVAPIEAGKPFQTEADLAAQRQLQDAWNRGLSVDEIIQLNQQIGRGAFDPDAIKMMRDARMQGAPINFYATPTGQPTAAEGVIGAALSTPVGEAVGGYTVGAANALTAGTLDELAPILGLDPARVQAAKDYLRERAPVSSFAGEVTGGVLGALPAIKGAQVGLAGTRFAGAAPLLGEIAYGTGYGAGEAQEGERLTGALIGGGAAGLGGALANRFLPGGPGTFTGMAPEVPAGALMPEMPPMAAIAPEAPPVATQIIAEPPVGAPLPSAGGAIEITAQDIARFTTPEDRAIFNQRQLEYIARNKKFLDQQAAQAAQTVPAPTPTPEVPPVAAAAPAPAAAAPMATEEMITLAQKSVSRTPGASKARAQLAEIAKTNPEAKAAADRLGVELPVDVLSDNAQLKEVTGLTRSQIGSEAKQAWNETVSAVSDRAHQAMDELDAVTDISQVSADVFDRLDKAQMGLGRQASALRQEVTDAVDVRGRVEAGGVKGWLEGRIADLGGGKEGIANLSPEEKRLWGIVSKGQPTYALINEQRDLIGQALEKGTGPWSNTNMKRLKDIYGALADDQINFIEASAGKEIADKQRAANTLFKQMYEGREQMERIFTKNLSGSLAPLMQRAITQGTKGNAQTLNTLVKIIPEDMRGKVLTSALFKAAKTTDDTFSFTNFANIYRDLRANGAIYKEFAKAVGPEGDKLLTDLYAISRRLSDADKAISRTGASTQLQLLNSERLLSRILMASGGAAGAGLIGSMLGGPGAAIVGAGLAAAAPEIAQRVGKTNAQKLHNLMSSAEFRELATSAATGDALDRNINRVAGSGAFRDFAKAAGIELKQGRNWLRSAITAGAVGEAGPEAGPPEGAIIVRPQ
jgi:hypothetical protein